MEGIEIKRLDHLGVVAGVIKDLNLVELIDERLKRDEQDQEKITAGEAIAGMILNGLGFSDKPLSLTPLFFNTKALEALFREGVKAEYFNRHKLGSVLDRIHTYDCEKLFFELAASAHTKEKIDDRFMSEDTTSFSLTGEYSEETDEQTITITQGYSKDLRPDLKQVVQELFVSQDGGVPLMMKCFDGNASDNKIFKERTKLLVESFKKSKSPRYLIADSKLYHEGNAENLQKLNFITRIPSTLKEEKNAITESIFVNQWEKLDAENKFHTKTLNHYGILQRWMVIYSNKARDRSKKTLEKAVKREGDDLKKKLWHLSKQAYGCEHDAENAAEVLMKKVRYHQAEKKDISEKKVYEELGRPKKDSIPSGIHYFITVEIKENQELINATLEQRSCYVVGTNADASDLKDAEVIEAYKRQNSSIENMGFRFLKDPVFFASSLFLKKPSRIMGLLTVMTLALLVYSIAQKRLRKALEEQNEMLPNQIKKPTKKPTMRWIFQLLEGIDILKMTVNGAVKIIVHGLSEIKHKIICLMGETTRGIYGIAENSKFVGGG